MRTFSSTQKCGRVRGHQTGCSVDCSGAAAQCFALSFGFSSAKALARCLLLNFLDSGFSCCVHSNILEKKSIHPDSDDINHNQNWNQYKPLILKLIGQFLNSENRQIPGDQSENESANAGWIQGGNWFCQ